ncbi:hypothetical protein FA15DRAFT_664274 [Coprinopsis marcescibilis]|uniref:C3H1-type domain-containing protein n=1 Tax=Coprinopsis marcescibilis TaxID=230819 RepID=A0A5C3L9M0_COPMA|nr:hypothetical protein FA15DRAFT_664274 [Coprinopsis marcescibilis]
MATQPMGSATQQLWDDALTRIIHLSSSTIKRNTELEARVAELEVELLVWKQAHSAVLETSEAHNVQIAALNRQISNLDYFKNNQNPLILCVINGNELSFNRELLLQGYQGGRLAAQEITKTIAEHLTKEEVYVYGRLSFWITIYLSKSEVLDTLLSNNVCTETQFHAFNLGFSQASARFSVIDVGSGKEAIDSKIKEYLQTFVRFPQTIRLFFGGYDASTYAVLFNTLEREQFLGKIALLQAQGGTGDIQPSHPLPRLLLDGVFMPERFQASPKRLSPLSTNHYNSRVSNGGLISPQSPERSSGRVIDPTLPLHKQNPPPCNEHYLMTCSKGAGACKYSHDYLLSPEQLTQLANNAKKAPCNWLKNGVPCPYGDKCCWGHICPNGPKCFHLSKGKCWFKGDGMHMEGTTST